MDRCKEQATVIRTLTANADTATIKTLQDRVAYLQGELTYEHNQTKLPNAMAADTRTALDRAQQNVKNHRASITGLHQLVRQLRNQFVAAHVRSVYNIA